MQQTNLKFYRDYFRRFSCVGKKRHDTEYILEQNNLQLEHSVLEQIKETQIEYVKNALEFFLSKESFNVSTAVDLNMEFLFIEDGKLLIDVPDIAQMVQTDEKLIDTSVLIRYFKAKLKYLETEYADGSLFMEVVFNKADADPSWRKVVRLFYFNILFRLFKNAEIEFTELSNFKTELYAFSKIPDDIFDNIEATSKYFKKDYDWKVSTFSLPFVSLATADATSTLGSNGEGDLGSVIPNTINVKQLLFSLVGMDFNMLFKAVQDTSRTFKAQELIKDIFRGASADDIVSRLLEEPRYD